MVAVESNHDEKLEVDDYKQHSSEINIEEEEGKISSRQSRRASEFKNEKIVRL